MDTPTSSPNTVDALHVIRIGGSPGRDDLVSRAGAETVDALLAAGLATAVGTRVLLTPSGRTTHQQALAAEVDERGCRADLERCYQAFLPLNTEVLQLCTDWQVRLVDGAPSINDHRDVAYDRGVIGRLRTVHARAGGLLDDLASVLPRLAPYGGDLARAAARVADGDTDFLTNPRVRCFHTVWFELHEDLLATLGIDRVDEGDAAVAPSR